MRLFHISDLHIGKQLYRYSLAENQRAILQQIAEQVSLHRPDVLLIAGDIFDKAIPSGEAYKILDEFLSQLSNLQPQIPVCIIAGNHDSAQRLEYASSFLEQHQIHIAVLPPQSEEEHLKKIVMEDEYGKVNIYLLPFLKPGYVRQVFPEQNIESYDQAVRELIRREQIDTTQRNVLVSHQFYKSGSHLPDLCDSEQTIYSIGGLDSVDVSAVDMFDYVALGHLHGAQQVGKPWIRYCGTPLAYSLSEEHHDKSITMAELGEKGSEVRIETIPLEPSQKVRRIKGTLQEILEAAGEKECNDFISVTLTDEIDPYHPRERLEERYKSLLELRIENSRTKQQWEELECEEAILTPMEAFGQFFVQMQGREMDEEEIAIMEEMLQQAGESLL